MKTFSITVEDDLYEIIKKDSASHQTSKSEIIRRRLTEAYHSQAKQEEKVVKAFEVFEKNISETLDKKFSKIEMQNVRSLSYTLSNYHLLKFILRDVLFENIDEVQQMNKVGEYASLAKAFALKVHPVDSLNSKENITSNIFPQHLE